MINNFIDTETQDIEDENSIVKFDQGQDISNITSVVLSGLQGMIVLRRLYELFTSIKFQLGIK